MHAAGDAVVKRRGVSRSASGPVLRPGDHLRFPCMSAEPCRNLVTIIFTCTGRPNTATTPGLVVSVNIGFSAQSPHQAMSCASRRLRELPGPASPLYHPPHPQAAQHVPGGDITTCCCSEQLVLVLDWIAQPMLALCVHATRGGHLLRRPTLRVVGQVAKKHRPSFT